MTLAVDRLIGDGSPSGEAIERFIEEHEFPLVEGPRVTFLFRGPADKVNLRHWIYGLPSVQPFQPVRGTDLWYLVQDIPACSRVEYKIERIVGDRHELLMDPLNPKIAQDPFGANSVAHGDGYAAPDWAEPDPEARPGQVEQRLMQSDVFGEKRPLLVYTPARFRERARYPLLVVHDGADYLRFAEMKIVLDNLIHRLEIPPVIVALTQSPNRLKEYAADPDHARFVVEELVPLMEDAYPLTGRVEDRCLVGASFGGVAALSTAWRHPGVFGRMLLQSGSFAFSDIGPHDRGPLFDPVVEFVNRFREEPGKPAGKVFLSCGIYEPLIYENRSLVPLLQSTGMDVRYAESRDGHNWDNWRDRLREGLSWLFPGPLWMVYE